jgi:hypothetical protein
MCIMPEHGGVRTPTHAPVREVFYDTSGLPAVTRFLLEEFLCTNGLTLLKSRPRAVA